ncbi:GNAT family N-acetyltransferase [Paramicrobacterium agarici]|uniref:GNAT family N-acetyltransferase n=1 Tax=Paramicrobacterium agarici TaxID=630514 RepID=UPI00114DB1F1|nr:RimJ/RimL family protein N-acetyltransferase [Microbacterium agarici]
MTISARLRPIERDDLEFLRDLANEPGVRRSVVGWDWPLSLAGQVRWFEEGPDSSKVRRFIVEGADGRRIGMTGLWEIDWHNRTAQTALKLGGRNERVRGLGFGTAAVKALMEFAFNDVGLHKLHSTILADNEPSLALYLRKCHWREEGVLREHVWRNGRHVDLVQVGILRSEFLANAGNDTEGRL